VLRAAEEEEAAAGSAAPAADTGAQPPQHTDRATPSCGALRGGSLLLASKSQSGGGGGGGCGGGGVVVGSTPASASAALPMIRPRRTPQPVTRYKAGAAPGPSALIRLYHQSLHPHSQGLPAVLPSELDSQPPSAPRDTPAPADRPLPLGSIPKMVPLPFSTSVEPPPSRAVKSSSPPQAKVDSPASKCPISAVAPLGSGRAQRARKRGREENDGLPAADDSPGSRGVAAPAAKRAAAAVTPYSRAVTRGLTREVGSGFIAASW
jgi:hypothetical protein